MDFEMIFSSGGGSDAGIVTDNTRKKHSKDEERTINLKNH